MNKTDAATYSRSTHAAPIVEEALDAFDAWAAEHDAGEHSDGVYMDCPICAHEWAVLTGGAR